MLCLFNTVSCPMQHKLVTISILFNNRAPSSPPGGLLAWGRRGVSLSLSLTSSCPPAGRSWGGTSVETGLWGDSQVGVTGETWLGASPSSLRAPASLYVGRKPPDLALTLRPPLWGRTPSLGSNHTVEESEGSQGHQTGSWEFPLKLEA